MKHYIAPNLYCVISSFAEKNAPKFADDIKKLKEWQIFEYLCDCSEIEWHEGTVICEKEIERRGLHIGDPKERFKL